MRAALPKLGACTTPQKYRPFRKTPQSRNDSRKDGLEQPQQHNLCNIVGAAVPPPMRRSRVLKRIRLHLARSKDFPSGSAHHGYEAAPLDADATAAVASQQENYALSSVERTEIDASGSLQDTIARVRAVLR